MFEGMTFDYILKRALKNVSGNVDKRVGSVIYDAIAPCCMEIAKIYEGLDEVLKETFADTAGREFLIRRAAERGISPKSSSPAVMKGVFNIDVPVGSRFYIDSVTYRAEEKISDGVFKLVCEATGRDGHRHFGKILPLDNIEGLETAEITDVIVTGEDEEDTEVFRKRYFDGFSALAFGGNKKDYIEKVNLISGVGGCKVFPAFFGGGTVRLVIISSDYSPVSDEFARTVKLMADPYGAEGEGVGFAPIGHKVFVDSVSEKNINIDIRAEFYDDYDFDFIRESTYQKISDYFYELSKGWADCDRVEIVAMKIGTEIFDISGVKNVFSVALMNGGDFLSLILNRDEIPVIGKITLNGNVLEGI